VENRIVRKILGHTVPVWLNVHAGHAPLQFGALAA